MALLLSPGLVLIDHGHFQYNNVMLGLLLWAVAMFVARKYARAVLCLMLAISFKHLSMYALPAFGAALLGVAFSAKTSGSVLFRMIHWGLVAAGTLATAFAPFLQSQDAFLSVLRRLFPVHRGLFEEKVGNVWCSLAILTKFHRKRTNEQLFRLCLTVVMGAIAPVCVGLFVKAARGRLGPIRMLLGLTYVCLAMYLFSFHVHEKQILIPLVPLLFLSVHSPWIVYLATVWSSFSLHPLMRKDGLLGAYFALQLVWHCVFWLAFSPRLSATPASWRLAIILSLDFILLHHLAEAVWTPPAKLPDLFLALNTLSCSGAFSLIALYLGWQFWSVQE